MIHSRLILVRRDWTVQKKIVILDRCYAIIVSTKLGQRTVEQVAGAYSNGVYQSTPRMCPKFYTARRDGHQPSCWQ